MANIIKTIAIVRNLIIKNVTWHEHILAVGIDLQGKKWLFPVGIPESFEISGLNIQIEVVRRDLFDVDNHDDKTTLIHSISINIMSGKYYEVKTIYIDARNSYAINKSLGNDSLSAQLS